MSLSGYRDIYRTYGPRSYAYAEMVFGNVETVRQLSADTRQVRIFAMRAPRAIPLPEVIRRTRLTVDEVQRFNPALRKQVPARGTLYLPVYVKEFGPDVSFWHRPAGPSFTAVLNDFVRANASLEEWDDRSFESIQSFGCMGVGYQYCWRRIRSSSDSWDAQRTVSELTLP